MDLGEDPAEYAKHVKLLQFEGLNKTSEDECMTSCEGSIG